MLNKDIKDLFESNKDIFCQYNVIKIRLKKLLSLIVIKKMIFAKTEKIIRS